jgi:ABC-2 type transport system permease protein
MVHRERSRGTLEYLLTTPTRKLDVLAGYVIAFTIPAVVQVGISLAITYYLLGIHVAGAWWAVGLLAVMNSVLGVVMGLFATNLVRSEFQLVLMLPAVAVPHLLLSGLFRSPSNMTGWMHDISDFLPWHYAVGAVAELQKHVSATSTLWYNVAVTAGFIFVMSTIITNTVFSRRTA